MNLNDSEEVKDVTNTADENKEVTATERLEFERARLEFAQKVAEENNSWWNKNSSGLIAAGVSLIAVAVSISQAWIASIQSDLKRQEVKNSIATFVMNNREVISAAGTSDKQITEQKLLRNIMERSYSPEDCAPVFEILKERAASVASRNVWSAPPQAQTQTTPQTQPSATPPTHTQKVYLHYQDIQDKPILDAITANLNRNGFDVQGSELRQEITKGDVRYFFPNDDSDALRVKTIVEQSLRGKELELKPMIGLYNNVSRGVYEVWLPRLSQ